MGSSVASDPAEEDCLDPPMSRTLAVKTWCHGQLLACPLGITYGYWGSVDGSLPWSARGILMACALLLPAWTVASWLLLSEGTLARTRLLLLCGSGLLPLYAFVTVLCLGPTSGLQTLALVASALQLVETAAFLLVVACVREALAEHAASREREAQPLV